MMETIDRIVRAIRKKTDFVPLVGLTLGSGLGGFADHMEEALEISYKDLPGFPVSTAPGHDGKFIFGYVEGVPVICMKGRVHYYEGYTPQQVVLPLRVMHALGAKILFLTNASGGIRDGFDAGTLVMLDDHISLFAPNPLIGPNEDSLGVRFPDMTEVYDKELREIIRKAAKDEDIPLESGVYVQLTGPSFESPAEIRLLKKLGADLAGMSTVMEAIAARHAGMRVCCISLVANLAAGISPTPLTSEEVNEAGEAAAPVFTRLVKASIKGMKDLQ